MNINSIINDIRMRLHDRFILREISRQEVVDEVIVNLLAICKQK